jgi:hypothetical protein
MNNKYPLEWLDSLVLQHFNPRKADMKILSETDLRLISETVLKESNRIQVRIKNEIFALRKKRQIRLQVRKYHSTLIFLLDKIVEHHKSKEFKIPCLSKIAELIIRILDELLSFIENRFSIYLSLDERVPITYLAVSRNELQFKLKKLKLIKLNSDEDKITLAIVVNELSNVSNTKSNYKVTFRQIIYERTLLKNLEQMDNLEESVTIFSDLDVILIGMNFNSSDYIHVLIDRFLNQLNKIDNPTIKLSVVSLYFKECNQLNSNGKIIFDASQQNIKTVLDNWFKHEIAYLERQIELTAATNLKVITNNEEPQAKLQCDLSADQIGLILRAADEARIVKSRSMSLVFQTIVPYLSTAFKNELSYQSVRSKSYNAEENDKNVAIKTLEKIIKKIESY